jgi:acetolactate synthase-1/2/3 large subunit
VGQRRRTICVVGDGSMLMSSLELTVAVERNLPVTCVVLNDAGLGMVRHGQRLGGAESIAHEISPVRFDQIAQACGAQGMRINRLSDLAHVPREWLESDDAGPCLLDVQIDRDAVPPMADRVLGLATGIPK